MRLEGVGSNRAAFGAKLKVTIVENGKRRSIYRTVGFGSSFGGNPLEQHVGIGKAGKVEEVEVAWPASGIVDRVQDVQVDRRYTLREGEGKLIPEAKGQTP
jgi:hypothetical protein